MLPHQYIQVQLISEVPSTPEDSVVGMQEVGNKALVNGIILRFLQELLDVEVSIVLGLVDNSKNIRLKLLFRFLEVEGNHTKLFF